MTMISTPTISKGAISNGAVPIEFRNLRRNFGATRAVDDVSFSVAAGEVCGYIGPNGAGKTTSMRILATLDDPTSGDALVDGFSVVDDPDRVRRRLGFMPDHFGSEPNVAVWEYTDFFARAYGLLGRERTAAVRRVMDFTGLDVLAEKPIDGLSKGMKQRLCLGRALVHDPPVLVLDEPAAGLDPRARIQLREMIRQLAADGKAVLISSHILSELAEMCDKVAIIEQGRLLAVGRVDEIHRAENSLRAVQVVLLDRAGELASWLEARGTFEEIRVEALAVSFAHRGTPEEEAALLREMVVAGFAVAAYGPLAGSLEEVFLKVTEGRVQ